MKNTSLRVGTGVRGTVIDVRVFTRDGQEKDDRTLEIERIELAKERKNLDDEFRIVEGAILARLGQALTGREIASGPGVERDDEKGPLATAEYLAGLERDDWFRLRMADDALNTQIEQAERQLRRRKREIDRQFDDKKKKIEGGNKLRPGRAGNTSRSTLAIKRRIQPGDKMAGRHGNKGVVSVIMPVEDMPFDDNGEPVDIVLNPLGVPSRMNVGQVLEAHLGWAAKGLGERIGALLEESGSGARSAKRVRQLLEDIYNDGRGRNADIDSLSDDEVRTLAAHLRHGVPISTPVFDGASEEDIKALLRKADLPSNGQTVLFDGRTGDRFDRPVTVGYMYMLKLEHLVDNKMHCRSTGSYSLGHATAVARQGAVRRPAIRRDGGVGVGSLRRGAHPAGDAHGQVRRCGADARRCTRTSWTGNLDMDAGMPESFNVLRREIQSLGIAIEQETD